MFLKLLRMAAAFCLLLTFWSGVRIGVSTFELMAPVVIVMALAYKPRIRGPGLDAFKLVLTGLALMVIADLISAPGSYDPSEHLLKILKLVAAFTLVISLSYVLTNRRILTTLEIFYMLAISGAVCSFVAILQGQLGILTGLIPQTDPTADITRMTGLSEHPIEAGIVAAYSAVIALGIGVLKRKWLIPLGIIAVDVYSMKFSASITSVLAFLVGSGLLCLYLRSYKVLVLGSVGVICFGILALTLSSGSGILAARLADLAASKGSFTTVQSREQQLSKSLAMITPETLLVGNGYSTADLPYRTEIHNGIIASVFHFGLLGVTAQFFLISFFVSRMWQQSARVFRGIHLACITVFALSYLSGPPQARPSLWAPVIIIGSILTAHRGAGEAKRRVSPHTLTRPNGNVGRYA